MRWKAICAANDLQNGEMRSFCGNPRIAIYRVDDEFFATAATCTHMESDLTEGYLDGDVVECALHAATFSIRSGEALALPATEPLRVFDVKIEDNQVYVGLSDDDS